MPTFRLVPLVAAALIGLGASSPAAAHNSYDFAAPAAQNEAAQQRAAYIREHYTKFEYRIPMRDGTHLFTAVYLPNDASPQKTYPLLLVRTPYSVGPYGAANYRDALGPTAAYEKDGFIFVFQDVRGRYLSEGEFVNMRPHIAHKKTPTDIDESSDTWDSIEWLIRHLPHHNGKVGQWGISYPGYYTSAGAIDSHPALKAVSPQAPIADWFRGDDMHRNGAFNLQMAFGFFYGFGQPRPQPSERRGWKEFDFGTPDGYRFFLDLGSVANANRNLLKDGIPFWNEIAAHPNYDAFWQSRNILLHLKNIKAAVLTVAGWYDSEDLYGPLQTHRAIGKLNPGTPNQLIVGPWVHGGWTRSDGDKVGDAEFGYKTSLAYQPLELAFFQHHLKGGATPALPKAWMFETGANRWRGFDAWPPQAARSERLYFHGNGQLSFTPPAASESAYDEYLSDPAKPVPYTTETGTHWSKNFVAADQRFADSRPDVLSWQSAPLERDVTLAGPLTAELFVSTSGSDADFVVKLIDVNPPDMPAADGTPNRGNQQTLVRGEPFRGRFRDSFETPQAFVPNQPTRVQFELNDVLHTFQRGHRIMVQVQSSWFPFIDRNPQSFVPNIFEAKDSDFIKATQRVYHQPAQPSALKVQVLPALDQK